MNLTEQKLTHIENILELAQDWVSTQVLAEKLQRSNTSIQNYTQFLINEGKLTTKKELVKFTNGNLSSFIRFYKTLAEPVPVDKSRYVHNMERLSTVMQDKYKQQQAMIRSEYKSARVYAGSFDYGQF